MVGLLMQNLSYEYKLRISNIESVMTRCNPEFKEVWARKLQQLLDRKVEIAHERMVEDARSVH